jgi:hypothetical protein
MLDTAVVERTVLVALAFVIVIACIGTVLLYLGRVWVLQRTGLRLLTNAVALLVFAAVYLAAASSLTVITNYQINGTQPTSDTHITTYLIHFGVPFKLLPLVAMSLAWCVLAVLHRRQRTSVRTAV